MKQPMKLPTPSEIHAAIELIQTALRTTYLHEGPHGPYIRIGQFSVKLIDYDGCEVTNTKQESADFLGAD